MENDIHQKIEQRLAELPRDVQEAIASSELGEKLQAIGKAQGLHIDQMEALSDEVMLAMLGFVELEDLPHSIERQVRVDSARAQAITDAVNKEIFLSIRESMKAWAANRNAAAQTPAPLVPAPAIAPSAPSVVMPSSVAPAVPPDPLSKQSAPTAAPTQAPAVIAPALSAAPAPAPKPAPKAPDFASADAILSEKRVAPPAPAPASAASAPSAASPATSPAPKADRAQPQPYVADPYREPVE